MIISIATFGSLWINDFFGERNSLEKEYYRGIYTICKTQTEKIPESTELCNTAISIARYRHNFYESKDTEDFVWPPKRLTAEEIQ